MSAQIIPFPQERIVRISPEIKLIMGLLEICRDIPAKKKPKARKPK
jgi:hypothetical protein